MTDNSSILSENVVNISDEQLDEVSTEVISKPTPTPTAPKTEPPKRKRLSKDVPEVNYDTKATPNETELNKDVPDETELTKAVPPHVNPENVIVVDGEEREIKPTRLVYQRNGTAMAYHMLDLYPLPDIMAMEKGVLDPKRDGDQIVFDFLTAVFDDGKFVSQHYDHMDSETVDRAVKIFKRLNHIEDKEEASKNRAAKATTN